MTEETIDITPNFNLERIQAYADLHETRDPQTHITSQLEALSWLSDLIEEIEDTNAHTKYDKLVEAVRKRHRETSNELLGWFQ